MSTSKRPPSLGMMDMDPQMLPMKKRKLGVADGKQTKLNDSDIAIYSLALKTRKFERLQKLRPQHKDALTELFFLQNSGNLLDMQQWAERQNSLLDRFLLRSLVAEPEPLISTVTHAPKQLSPSKANVPKIPPLKLSKATLQKLNHETAAATSPKIEPLVEEPIKVEPPLPKTVSTNVALRLDRLLSAASCAVSVDVKPPLESPKLELADRDEVAELAKQEAKVVSRVSELRKQGLWTPRRLPKIQEFVTGRTRSHWDYVLDEMQWMAVDFSQERLWKRAAARMIAKRATAYVLAQRRTLVLATATESMKRAVARRAAMLVAEFWSRLSRLACSHKLDDCKIEVLKNPTVQQLGELNLSDFHAGTLFADIEPHSLNDNEISFDIESTISEEEYLAQAAHASKPAGDELAELRADASISTSHLRSLYCKGASDADSSVDSSEGERDVDEDTRASPLVYFHRLSHIVDVIFCPDFAARGLPNKPKLSTCTEVLQHISRFADFSSVIVDENVSLSTETPLPTIVFNLTRSITSQLSHLHPLLVDLESSSAFACFRRVALSTAASADASPMPVYGDDLRDLIDTAWEPWCCRFLVLVLCLDCVALASSSRRRRHNCHVQLRPLAPFLALSTPVYWSVSHVLADLVGLSMRVGWQLTGLIPFASHRLVVAKQPIIAPLLITYDGIVEKLRQAVSVRQSVSTHRFITGKNRLLAALIRRYQASSLLVLTARPSRVLSLAALAAYLGRRSLVLDAVEPAQLRQLLFDGDSPTIFISSDPFTRLISHVAPSLGAIVIYDVPLHHRIGEETAALCARLSRIRQRDSMRLSALPVYRLVLERSIEERLLDHPSALLTVVDTGATATYPKQFIERVIFGRSDSIATKHTTSAATTNLSPDDFDALLAASADEDAEDDDLRLQLFRYASALTNRVDADDVGPSEAKRPRLGGAAPHVQTHVEKVLASNSAWTPLWSIALKPVEQLCLARLVDTEDRSEDDASSKLEISQPPSPRPFSPEPMECFSICDDVDEDSDFLTYPSAASGLFLCDIDADRMPMWSPPTPPRDDADAAFVSTPADGGFLYERSTMPETALPDVIASSRRQRGVRAARKDAFAAAAAGALKRSRPDSEPFRAPRSLFTMRHESRIKQQRQAERASDCSLRVISRPLPELTSSQHEWLVLEDWCLLMVIKYYLELPLDLLSPHPAQTINWDLVCDVINSTAAYRRLYRSVRQCRHRFESVIVPREEGRIYYEMARRKKSSKQQVIKSAKNTRPLKTSQVYAQENSQQLCLLFTIRFDLVRDVAAKRPHNRYSGVDVSKQASLLSDQQKAIPPTISKNGKHVQALADQGIKYDSPMQPEQVAKIRAERIAKDRKQKEQQSAASSAAAATVPTTTASSSMPSASSATALGSVTVVSNSSDHRVGNGRSLNVYGGGGHDSALARSTPPGDAIGGGGGQQAISVNPSQIISHRLPSSVPQQQSSSGSQSPQLMRSYSPAAIQQQIKPRVTVTSSGLLQHSSSTGHLVRGSTGVQHLPLAKQQLIKERQGGAASPSRAIPLTQQTQQAYRTPVAKTSIAPQQRLATTSSATGSAAHVTYATEKQLGELFKRSAQHNRAQPNLPSQYGTTTAYNITPASVVRTLPTPGSAQRTVSATQRFGATTSAQQLRMEAGGGASYVPASSAALAASKKTHKVAALGTVQQLAQQRGSPAGTVQIIHSGTASASQAGLRSSGQLQYGAVASSPHLQLIRQQDKGTVSGGQHQTSKVCVQARVVQVPGRAGATYATQPNVSGDGSGADNGSPRGN